MKAFLNDIELDLPPDFALPIEQHSPIFSLDELRIADFSMNITFPGTSQNQRAFNFAHQLHQREKTIVYENFRLETENGVMHGVLELARTGTGDSRIAADYETTFFTNLLPIDIFETPLKDIVNKTVPTGADTNQVIAFAKSQNAAQMSSNGITGAIMKFQPHYNPKFYADLNPDFYPKAEEYDREKTYEVDDRVWINAHETREGRKYFICIDDAPEHHHPLTATDYWQPYAAGIVNAWDSDQSRFPRVTISYLNGQREMDIPEWYRYNSIDRYNLVPWLQLHDVIRNLAEALGYKAVGDYMDDPEEQRALLFSNFALDDRRFDKVIAVRTEPVEGDTNFVHIPAVQFEPPEEYDPLDIWDNNEGGVINDATKTMFFHITGKFTPVTDDWFYNVVRLWVWPEDEFNPIGDPRMHYPRMEFFHDQFYTGICDFETQVILPPQMNDGFDRPTKLYFFAEGYNTNTTNVDFIRVDLSEVLIEVLFPDTYADRVYAPQINYRDHMPDMTAAEWLLALKQFRNLHISFNPLSREMALRYADAIYANQQPATDITLHHTAIEKTEHKPEKRFLFNFQSVPMPAIDLDDYIILAPVSTITELPPPPPAHYPTGSKSGFACIVQNENNWYITTTREVGTSKRLIWKRHGTNYPDLRVHNRGELTEIKPAVSTLPMTRIYDAQGYEVLMPESDDTGRSRAFPLDGSRPDFKILYWLSIDTSGDSPEYPLSSPVGRNTAGTTLWPTKMDWEYIYNTYYLHTLPSLALEEIITATYYLSPYLAQLITFHYPVLLQHVPTLFIRTSRTIAAGERLLQAESRKIKTMKLEIVEGGGDAPEPEFDLWTPADIDTLLWLDFNDSESIILDNDNNIQEALDKSGNNNNATQIDADKRPGYQENELNVLTNDGSDKYLNCEIILSGNVTIFQVFNNSRINWYMPVVARTPDIFGVRSNNNPITSYNKAEYVDGYAAIVLPPGERGIMSGVDEVPGNTVVPLCIGGDIDYANRRIIGSICEYIILDNVITTGLRQKIEGYLAHKWKLSHKLPVIHPYRSMPPVK